MIYFAHQGASVICQGSCGVTRSLYCVVRQEKVIINVVTFSIMTKGILWLKEINHPKKCGPAYSNQRDLALVVKEEIMPPLYKALASGEYRLICHHLSTGSILSIWQFDPPFKQSDPDWFVNQDSGSKQPLKILIVNQKMLDFQLQSSSFGLYFLSFLLPAMGLSRVAYFVAGSFPYLHI